MLGSFDLENNHENLEQQSSINRMDTKLLEASITQQWRQHHANLCLEEIWSIILPSEQTEIQYKIRKQEIINNSNQKENKSQSPYE
jgi:hypothetical protein